ncbi:MAG: flagellar assembly protein A [Spirochaetaceae bacterium]
MARQETVIQGSIELTIDERGLKASVLIDRSGGDEEWTPSRVVEQLLQRGVKEGYDAKEIARLFDENAKKGRNPFRFVAAEGTPPEDPSPEQFSMDRLPIPEGSKEAVERVLAQAEQPRITIERKRKVEKQKTVTRKPKFPFGSPKKVEQTVVEEETVPERVYVDPTVQQTGYAEAGQRLGEVVPQSRGTPGRSIYGGIVHPRNLADPHFYVGTGATRSGNVVTAEVTGAVRRGPNWIDVVPYESHDWTLTLSKDRATAYLSFSPGHSEAAPPTPEEIVQEARNLGYDPDNLISPEEIKTLLNDAINSGTDMEEVPISNSRDASYNIYVSDDQLQAVLNVHKGKGRGRPLSLKELGKAIQSTGLKKLDFERIKKDILEFYHGSEQDLTGYVLAEGTAPTPGPDGEMEFAVRFLEEREMEPYQRAARERPELLGDVDSIEEFPVADVSRMARVQPEQRILTAAPAGAGQPGTDVYGRQIPPPTGAEPKLKLLENVQRKDGVVFATREGLLEEAQVDDVTYLRVRPHRDCSIQVELGTDRMRAMITLKEGEGTGLRLTEEAVFTALDDAGVTYGVDDGKVRDGLIRAQHEGGIVRWLVAEGTPPEEGSDGKLEFLIKLAGGKDVTLREDGTADYKNRDLITTVKAGTPVARIEPPQEKPRPGTDVTGKEIPPLRGEAVNVEVGENLEQESDQDGVVTLTARTDGEVLYERRRLSIRATHTVKGTVGVETGNIKFPGSVTVSGSVQSGYVIMAGGDIRIGESVEGCLLSADGNIMIKEGVKGAGKAVLRTKKNIGVAFAEHATLLAVGEIVIRTSCFHTTVKANGSLRMQTEKGSIVGGNLRVRKGVETQNLGSSSGAHTHVSFGQDYLVADQIEREEREVEKLKRRITTIDLSLQKVTDSSPIEEVESLRKEKKMLLKMMEHRSLRLFNLRERFEEHFPSEVRVKGTLFPGVVVESHGRTREYSERRKSVRIYFDLETGRIMEEPLNADAAE